MIQKRPRAAKMTQLGRTEETKRRNGVILVAGATVLVAGVTVGGILLLTGGSGSDDEPTTVAREFAALYQRGLNSSGRDVEADEFEPLVCTENMQNLRDAFSEKQNPVPGMPQFTLTVKDVKTDGDRGTFTMGTHVTSPGVPDENADEQFTLVVQDGDWRVCGL
ncbi:hypothetical protein LWC34_11270 [Kibdelosporangium philippinense]|uniref:Low molecular weight antigen MTB12-like C-terminal domain-containing protein n=1 Tax=Kibdelosporangium philippinense TaxID=211113 RepID=A0ABS8Z691_9PSEU|nr:hypothetical protein [Kibdelosporangium philippinense]MCE7003404.1 hypothetical protein [Kibdelosporangium philippinense]